MSLQKKVSIITVSYNAAETIERTIKSVVEQDYNEIEYIIIDGASKDNTMDVVRKYSDRISVIISEKDYGIYDAMNKGIKNATGDIITLLNADDYYSSNHVVSDVIKRFNESDAQIVYGDALYINWDNSGKDYIFCERQPLSDLWWGMSIPHPTVFVKKEIYQKYGMFDLKYKTAADYDFILRCYADNVKFEKISDVLVNFVFGGFSTQNFMTSAIETIKIAVNYIEKAPNIENVLKHNLERIHNALAQQRRAELMNYLGEKKEDIEYVVIFGTGKWGEKMISLFESIQIKILYCVDSNKGKWGTVLKGYSILSPEVLKSYKGVIAIASKYAEEQIFESILSLGNEDITIIRGTELF